MKRVLILVIVLVAIGGGLYFYKNSAVMDGGYTSAPKETLNPGTVDTTKPVVETTSSGTGSVSVEKIFTMNEISKHNSRTSCYTTVRGDVYDLTNFKDSHPGGEEAILSICGKDGSSAFENQHGGQRKPENQLAKLKIGVLAK